MILSQVLRTIKTEKANPCCLKTHAPDSQVHVLDIETPRDAPASADSSRPSSRDDLEESLTTPRRSTSHLGVTRDDFIAYQNWVVWTGFHTSQMSIKGLTIVGFGRKTAIKPRLPRRTVRSARETSFSNKETTRAMFVCKFDSIYLQT